MKTLTLEDLNNIGNEEKLLSKPTEVYLNGQPISLSQVYYNTADGSIDIKS